MDPRYAAMKATFLREKGRWYVDKINGYIDAVQEVLENSDTSYDESDGAMNRALAFFNRPLPAISDEENAARSIDGNISSNEELKDELAELKREVLKLKASQENNKELVKMVQKGKAKTKTLTKNLNKLSGEVKNMETNHLLSTGTLEKNLTHVRNFMKRNHKAQLGGNAPAADSSGDGKSASTLLPAQVAAALNTSQPQPPGSGAGDGGVAAGSSSEQAQKPVGGKSSSLPVAVEFPAPPPKEPLKVDLKPVGKPIKLKPPGDGSSSFTDLVVFSDDRVILAEDVHNSAVLKVYNLDGELKHSESVPRKGVKLAVLSSAFFAFTEGPNLVLQKYEKRYNWSDAVWRYHWEEDKTIFTSPNHNIAALTALNSTSLAVAAHTTILLMDTNGKVYRKIATGILITWEICAPSEDVLVILNTNGLLTCDTYDGQWKKVRQRNSVSCVSGFVEGHYFVCDSKAKELYLLGPDSGDILQVWSLANQLKPSDELLYVSAYVDGNGNCKCLCLTRFGVMLVFNMKQTKA